MVYAQVYNARSFLEHSCRPPCKTAGVYRKKRFIYIHGTPDTTPMGQPGSHGCIRMRNQDVVALADWVQVGTPILIEE